MADTLTYTDRGIGILFNLVNGFLLGMGFFFALWVFRKFASV